jgi:hypothetical protein
MRGKPLSVGMDPVICGRGSVFCLLAHVWVITCFDCICYYCHHSFSNLLFVNLSAVVLGTRLIVYGGAKQSFHASGSLPNNLSPPLASSGYFLL